MSYQRRDIRPTRTASKRRAAARKRTREIGRYVFAYSIIALLVLGTISSLFVGLTPVGTVAPTPVASAPTYALDTLVTQADQEAAQGNWDVAVSYYQAYLAQNALNAEVNFKLGKALLNRQPADYAQGVAYLQRALSLDSTAPFAAEAQALIEQNRDKAATSVPITGTAGGPSGIVTGTGTVTATVTMTP